MKKQIKRTRRKRNPFNIYAGILTNNTNEYIEIFAKDMFQANEMMELEYPNNGHYVYKAGRYTETTLKKVKTLDYRNYITEDTGVRQRIVSSSPMGDQN